MVKFEVYMTCDSDGNPLNIEELLKAINKINDRDKKNRNSIWNTNTIRQIS